MFWHEVSHPRKQRVYLHVRRWHWKFEESGITQSKFLFTQLPVTNSVLYRTQSYDLCVWALETDVTGLAGPSGVPLGIASLFTRKLEAKEISPLHAFNCHMLEKFPTLKRRSIQRSLWVSNAGWSGGLCCASGWNTTSQTGTIQILWVGGTMRTFHTQTHANHIPTPAKCNHYNHWHYWFLFQRGGIAQSVRDHSWHYISVEGWRVFPPSLCPEQLLRQPSLVYTRRIKRPEREATVKSICYCCMSVKLGSWH